jgi:hypothetical protein
LAKEQKRPEPFTVNAARLVAILAFAACAACGGGGGGDAPATAAPSGAAAATPLPASAGGLWFSLTGPVAGGSTALTLMIAENGDMRVTAPPTATSGPAFGYGAVTVSDNRVAGSFKTRALPASGSPTNAAGLEIECTLDGTVNTRVTMQLTIVCTDAAGNVTSSTLGFTYDSRYDGDSSLAAIAGNYTLSVNSTGNTLNINGDGTLFGTYQNGPRCTIGGRVTIVDTDFNLYRFEMSFSSCTVFRQYEGVTMTGFGTRNVPGQIAGSFMLLLTAVIDGRLEFISVIYQPV